MSREDSEHEIRVNRVLKSADPAHLDRFMVLPNDLHASDHFPVVADFCIVNRKPKSEEKKADDKAKKEEIINKVQDKKEDIQEGKATTSAEIEKEVDHTVKKSKESADKNKGK